MTIQTIYGNPPSKSNCYRIITLNGHASLTKTGALRKYEEQFYIQCNQYRNKNITGYFEFYIDAFFDSQRQDLDNVLKCTLDCLQKVKAIKNDNKCVKIMARKFLDKANPRIEFSVIAI